MMKMGEYSRKIPRAAHSGPPEKRQALIQAATLAFGTALQRPERAPSPSLWPCYLRRIHVCLSVLFIFIAIFSIEPYEANAAGKKVVRKAIIKPFKYAYGDAVGHLLQGKISDVANMLETIVKRFRYPQYHIIGNAWFGALIFDLSEYVMRRPPCVDLKEAFSASEGKPISEGLSPCSNEWPAGTTLETFNSATAAKAKHGNEDVKTLALDVSMRGQPLSHRLDVISRKPQADDVHMVTPKQLTQETSTSFTFDVPELNPDTLFRWRRKFLDIFMQIAEQLLPADILDVVEDTSEEQYRALRPMLEHVLYKTLSEFYPTLMATTISESILPNFYFAVSCDACPFSTYTSYFFMDLISSGRPGAEALFLSDKLVHSKFESYVSEECRLFNEEMKLLSTGNVTLQDVVARLAAATPPSILTMADLVLAGKDNIKREKHEVAKTSEFQKAAGSSKVNGPSPEELASTIEALSIESQNNPVDSEVLVRGEYVDNVRAEVSKRRSLNPGETVGSPEVLALHEGTDEQAMEKLIQSVEGELLSSR